MRYPRHQLALVLLSFAALFVGCDSDINASRNENPEPTEFALFARVDRHQPLMLCQIPQTAFYFAAYRGEGSHAGQAAIETFESDGRTKEQNATYSLAFGYGLTSDGTNITLQDQGQVTTGGDFDQSLVSFLTADQPTGLGEVRWEHGETASLSCQFAQ